MFLIQRNLKQKITYRNHCQQSMSALYKFPAKNNGTTQLHRMFAATVHKHTRKNNKKLKGKAKQSQKETKIKGKISN